VIILGDKGVAFALIPLLTVPSPCYLYTWRPALPYVVAGASIVCLALLEIDGPARVAHSLVSTCAFLVIAAAMIVTRQRTLSVARHNRRLAYTDALTGIANIEACASGSRPGWAGRAMTDSRGRCLRSIWTTSSRSTIASITPSATGCCARSPPHSAKS